MAWRVVVGPGVLVLRIDEDGSMFVAAQDQDFYHCWWSAFEAHRGWWVLVGGDGRYRLVIPGQALSSTDLEVIHDRVHVKLAAIDDLRCVPIPRR